MQSIPATQNFWADLGKNLNGIMDVANAHECRTLLFGPSDNGVSDIECGLHRRFCSGSSVSCYYKNDKAAIKRMVQSQVTESDKSSHKAKFSRLPLSGLCVTRHWNVELLRRIFLFF